MIDMKAIGKGALGGTAATAAVVLGIAAGTAQTEAKSAVQMVRENRRIQHAEMKDVATQVVLMREDIAVIMSHMGLRSKRRPLPDLHKPDILDEDLGFEE